MNKVSRDSGNGWDIGDCRDMNDFKVFTDKTGGAGCKRGARREEGKKEV